MTNSRSIQALGLIFVAAILITYWHFKSDWGSIMKAGFRVIVLIFLGFLALVWMSCPPSGICKDIDRCFDRCDRMENQPGKTENDIEDCYNRCYRRHDRPKEQTRSAPDNFNSCIIKCSGIQVTSQLTKQYYDECCQKCARKYEGKGQSQESTVTQHPSSESETRQPPPREVTQHPSVKEDLPVCTVMMQQVGIASEEAFYEYIAVAMDWMFARADQKTTTMAKLKEWIQRYEKRGKLTAFSNGDKVVVLAVKDFTYRGEHQPEGMAKVRKVGEKQTYWLLSQALICE